MKKLGSGVWALACLLPYILQRGVTGFQQEIEGGKHRQNVFFLTDQLPGDSLLGGFAEHGAQIQQLLGEDLEYIATLESGAGGFQQDGAVLMVEVSLPCYSLLVLDFVFR